MTLHRDAYGLPITAPSRAAVDAFDHTVAGYMAYRADTPKRLEAMLEVAADMPMAQVLKGYLLMLGFKLALVPTAQAARVIAEARRASMNTRERAHLDALGAWIDGDVERTLTIWEAIGDEHPRDILAFRLHHFVAFWFGSVERMAGFADRVLSAYAPDEPVMATLLACKCFAYQELGRFADAEPAGREALARTPGDLWAAHAVAHVLEMQGRHDEGIALLGDLEPHWAGGNNLRHHLFWHRGLYHYERGEFDRVLNLYDNAFRDLDAPLTKAQPDVYTDVQNAASMLVRLEREGVDVGARWVEIADKAEARIGDHLNVFTLPHWMMALAATGRKDACDRMLDAMRADASKPGTVGPLLRDHAIPVCEAIVLRAAGRPDEALTRMRPTLDGLGRLGGSHAQQDVLFQIFLDCAQAARSSPDISRVIDHIRRTYTVRPEDRRGYAAATAVA